jgi:anti-anti-sigma factor
MSLTTSTEEVSGRVPITVLSLDGEVDGSNFESIVDQVKGLYDAGSRDLLLDLTGVTFMASSGLVALYSIVLIMRGEPPVDPESGWGAFHSIGDEVSSGSGQTQVQLAGPQPAVERVLERTGMGKLFPVHADRATAIAAF